MMGNSVVCTLFEGHYHYGVAALVNSLHKNGFRGEVYAGYKGQLPIWAKSATDNTELEWEGASSFNVVDGLQIHFLPLKTDYHLTNYKPDFMLRLWAGPAINVLGMFYFDPDIVVKCRWDFYEKWISYGVALVHEIISNDMPTTHPIRLHWRNIINKKNGKVVREIQSYINGGFVGVTKLNISFLSNWSNFIHTAITDYKVDPNKFMSLDRTYPFYGIDQDALNITAMSTEKPISEMGPEAMDFIHGGYTMSHAVGSPKPWKKNYLLSALKAVPPSLADKSFLNNACYPIILFNSNQILLKNLSIKIASFIGRFYRKY